MSVSEFFSGMFGAKATQPSPIFLDDSLDDESTFLKMEASALAGLGKANDVAQPVISAFDRSKATAEYSTRRTIYYTFVGIMRSISTGFYQDKAQNLDHYQKHKAFCEGIKKVSEAYTEYRAAEAAQKTSTDTLSKLRDDQCVKAAALIDNYNALIALAAGRAEYKEDIHKKLNNTDDGLILSTVNEALAKLEFGSVRDDAELKTGCKKFLLDFTGHSAQAVIKTGANSEENVKAVTDAFIEGFASFQEFASGDVDIIDMHAEFVRLRDPSEADEVAVETEKDQMVSDVVQHFTAAIEDLMNGEEPISLTDLQKISCQGIPLVAIRPFTIRDVEQLEALRKLRVERKEALEKRAKLSVENGDVQAVLAEKATHSVSDIADFVAGPQTADKRGRTLETVKAEGKLTGGFIRFYDLAADIVNLTAELTRFTDAVAAKESADALTIHKKQKSIDEGHVEIDKLLKKAEALKATALDNASKLQNLENEDAKNLKKNKAYVQLYKAFKAQKARLDALEKLPTEEEVKQGLQKAADEALKQRQMILDDVITMRLGLAGKQVELEQFKQQAEIGSAQNKQKISLLTAECEALSKTSIDLSGEEIRKMAEYLGLDPAVKTPTSSVTTALTTAREQHQSKVKLEGQIAVIDARVKDIQDVELKKRPGMPAVDGAYQFRVNDKEAFSDGMRGSIRDKIDENLDIAKEVTARIATSLAEKTQAARMSNREELAKLPGGALRAQVADMPSKLEARLDELDVDADEDALYQRIGTRVALFPTPPVQDDEIVDRDKHPTSEADRLVSVRRAKAGDPARSVLSDDDFLVLPRREDQQPVGPGMKPTERIVINEEV